MKCSECEYGKKVTMQFHGVGASWKSGYFAKDGYKCEHPLNKQLHEIFYGKTAPRNCKLKFIDASERKVDHD